MAMFRGVLRWTIGRAVSMVRLDEYDGRVILVEDAAVFAVLGMVAVDIDLIVDVGIDVGDEPSADRGAAVDWAHPEPGENEQMGFVWAHCSSTPGIGSCMAQVVGVWSVANSLTPI